MLAAQVAGQGQLPNTSPGCEADLLEDIDHCAILAPTAAGQEAAPCRA
jgi:hypothetical protein